MRHKFKGIKNLCISSVTYGELCYGIENGDATARAARWEQLDLFAQWLLIEPWDEVAARHYGFMRALLKKQGTPIGNNDLLIAAHARSINAVLVTNNLSEFGRVPDLSLENWVSA